MYCHTTVSERLYKSTKVLNAIFDHTLKTHILLLPAHPPFSIPCLLAPLPHIILVKHATIFSKCFYKFTKFLYFETRTAMFTKSKATKFRVYI